MNDAERDLLTKKITMGVDLLLRGLGMPSAPFILLVQLDDEGAMTNHALVLGNMLGRDTAIEACEAAIEALEDAIEHMRPN